MRRNLPIVMLLAAGSLAANGSVAHADKAAAVQIILSSADGALAPPDEWDCNRYVYEYDTFIDEGNRPENWRFAGKRYRAVKDGKVYDWSMWLDWRERQNCGGKVQQMAEGSGSGSGGSSGASVAKKGGMGSMGIILGLLGAAGAAGAAAGGGGGGGSEPTPKPKSPG